MTQLLEAFTSLKNPTLAGTKSTQRYGPQKCFNVSACCAHSAQTRTVRTTAQCTALPQALCPFMQASCPQQGKTKPAKFASTSTARAPMLSTPQSTTPLCRNCGGHGHGAHQCKRKEPPNHCILTLILATPSDYACATRGPLSLFSTSASNTTMTLPWPLASAKTPSFSSEWICPEEFCICDIIQLLNNFLTAGLLASDICSSACPYLGIFGRKETVASPTPLMSVCAHHPTYLTRSQKFSSGSAETSSPYMISYICWMTTSRLAHQHHQPASNAWTSSLPPATTPGCP